MKQTGFYWHKIKRSLQAFSQVIKAALRLLLINTFPAGLPGEVNLRTLWCMLSGKWRRSR
jgi:hypothetical protein